PHKNSRFCKPPHPAQSFSLLQNSRQTQRTPLKNPMLINGIINPHIQDLICRVRHTNALVIADAAFPSWPHLQTIDITLIHAIPTIIQVLDAILPNFKAGPIYMAEEFKTTNPKLTQTQFAKACRGVPITFE